MHDSHTTLECHVLHTSFHIENIPIPDHACIMQAKFCVHVINYLGLHV